MTLVIAKLALAVVAVAPHHHHEDPTELKASPPLTNHTAPNSARFKYHAGVSLHRAVLVIRRLQHLHREHRRQERRDRLSVASPPPVRASGSSPSASAPTGGLPDCTWRPESGGSYTAVNPSSGAYGKYQIIPSTWAAHCSDLGRDPAGQDACAGRVYRAQGAGAWVNC